MTDPTRWTGRASDAPAPPRASSNRPAGPNLADILERVLDKGIVIAGDIQINLLDIELLTIKLRLIVASVDRAKEMGIDWWERDPTLSSGHRELEDENRRLRDRLERLERAAPRATTTRPRAARTTTAEGRGGSHDAEEFAGEEGRRRVEEAEIVDDDARARAPDPPDRRSPRPEPVEAPRRRPAHRGKKQRS